MTKLFKVYSEDYKKVKVLKSSEEAEAYRYAQYGYTGYIVEYEDDIEIANHS